ncbi:MAG: NAD-dependent epimerase/dehydratase family protein, partial [Candidatus Omnitrophica bacterium]|nr:NAD-dependent epimerase/dehydratase family protein [Candidatus Omnitrophota bacterium]
MKTIFVTGGAGFIGCNFVRSVLRNSDANVVVIDKLTYAGSLYNLEDVADDPRYHFEQVDIADEAAIHGLFAKYQ